jgi:hypothetical protein
MQTVSRFESNLLRLLYYFLQREPAERGLPLVEARMQPPPCLSRPAVGLIKEALGKGCVQLLASRGGWRHERFLRNGQPVEGRLWQRTPPADLALTFSGHSLEFLIWITAARPSDKKPNWNPPYDELTPGDLLLLFLAHQGLRKSVDSFGAIELRIRPPFVHHGLCWLAYPEDFATAPADVSPSFVEWTGGVNAAILEALQPELEARWIQVEGAKGNVVDPRQMMALGRAQEVVLGAFLDAVEAANRLDLARFLLAAAAQLLGPHANADMWIGSLQMSGLRLAERSRANGAALTFLRQLDRLQGWDWQARSVGYFDEGYAASQLWKADWERYDGNTLRERAQGILREVDPMRQASG